ncbi:hypothetical protein BJY00DRAFT_312631 [Aspergillus carlsbadensis]|nr:hypothetical protein BJY00DRAFT_312631 [Aspergillus carlsbadensis]
MAAEARAQAGGASMISTPRFISGGNLLVVSSLHEPGNHPGRPYTFGSFITSNPVAIIMSHTSQPLKPVAPHIQLAPMPQLVEAICRDDDWTGTRDAAARRRAQTRLNTRAYRKRKALAAAKGAQLKATESTHTESTSTTDPQPKAEGAEETLVECWDMSQQSVAVVPALYIRQLYNARNPLLLPPDQDGRRTNHHHRQQHQHQFKNIIFPLCPDHLITLLQYNALRALATNRALINHLLTTPLSCTEEVIHVLPYPRTPQHMHSLPTSLHPTHLQQTIPHGDWIDLFPSPECRDRLIRATGTFDEDELWEDCIGGLYEGFPDDEIQRRGLIAWSPPWDVSGWEMSEGFVRKWGWLVRGVPGMLEATNRWRSGRGEGALVFEVD